MTGGEHRADSGCTLKVEQIHGKWDARERGKSKPVAGAPERMETLEGGVVLEVRSRSYIWFNRYSSGGV